MKRRKIFKRKKKFRHEAGEKVALLVDAQNVGIVRTAFALEEVKKQFPVAIFRAYGNWKTSAVENWSEELGNDVEFIPSGLSLVQGKNAADIRLAIDAMDLLFSEPEITHFVIVSSDSDFLPLAHRLKNAKKDVWCFGLSSLPIEIQHRYPDFRPLPQGNVALVKGEEKAKTVNGEKLDDETLAVIRLIALDLVDAEGWLRLGHLQFAL